MCSEVAAQAQDGPDPHEETLIWCGGLDAGQDVAIHLIPLGTNLRTPDPHADTLLVLKLHSHRLSQCSKYFETCLSERWRKPSTPTTTLFLEVHTDAKFYVSCFSRMYSPFLKGFHGVEPSLELLKVASQIEFHELMEAISRYVAGIPWSSEEELRIREYSRSPDFPACHVKDLAARLGLHLTEEDRHKHTFEVVEECTRTAFHHDGRSMNTRAFVEEFLQGVGSGTSSNVAKTVVSIVSVEAKRRFDASLKECEEKGGYHLVPYFKEKLLSICWVLRALLNARVAEELLRYMVELDAFATIVSGVVSVLRREPCKEAAVEMAKLILQTYSEVLDGHLILSTLERTALLRNWHVVLAQSFVSKDSYYLITKSFFLTLPLEQQMELIKLRKDQFTWYIDTSSLVALLKRSWPALESVQQLGDQLSQPGCEVFSSPSPSNFSKFGSSPNHDPASPCSG